MRSSPEQATQQRLRNDSGWELSRRASTRNRVSFCSHALDLPGRFRQWQDCIARRLRAKPISSFVSSRPSALAPISYNPTIFNSTLDTFLNASGVLSPGTATGHDRYMKAPDYYNLSLGVQQNVGFGTVLDVKYVSTLGRNLSQTRNINQLPYGVRFLPSSQDPSRPAGTPLTDNFLRPMPGYGSSTIANQAAARITTRFR